MRTPIGNLLRYLADQFDEGKCDLNEPALMKMAELQIKDHERLNKLTELLLSLEDEHEHNHPHGHPDDKKDCKFISINK